MTRMKIKRKSLMIDSTLDQFTCFLCLCFLFGQLYFFSVALVF